MFDLKLLSDSARAETLLREKGLREVRRLLAKARQPYTDLTVRFSNEERFRACLAALLDMGVILDATYCCITVKIDTRDCTPAYARTFLRGLTERWMSKTRRQRAFLYPNKPKKGIRDMCRRTAKPKSK